MVLGKLVIYMQKIKLDSYLTPLTEMNTKWIEDLNIQPEAINLLEESIRKKLFDTGLGNNFLGYNQKYK